MKSYNNWPQSDDASLINYFGPIGSSKQVRCRVPFSLRLSWAPEIVVNRVMVHQRTAASFTQVMETILNIYGVDAIREMKLDQWGGCFNVRRMRGGRRYSTHSWGIAHDFAPVQNPLQGGRHNSLFGRAQYIPFLNAWINEGWDSLGLSKGYDWMHFQATANDLQPIAEVGQYNV